MTKWHAAFIDSFEQDVPWEFRSKEETRDRWSRELCSTVQRYSDEFMQEVVTWAAKKFERKSKKCITLPELKDMCFAFLAYTRNSNDSVRVDERTRLRSICIRIKNAILVEGDLFKAWDLLCDAGSDYNCRKIQIWAEDQLHADFTPVYETYKARRIDAMSGTMKGVRNVRHENEREQDEWMRDLAEAPLPYTHTQEMEFDD